MRVLHLGLYIKYIDRILVWGHLAKSKWPHIVLFFSFTSYSDGIGLHDSRRLVPSLHSSWGWHVSRGHGLVQACLGPLHGSRLDCCHHWLLQPLPLSPLLLQCKINLFYFTLHQVYFKLTFPIGILFLYEHTNLCLFLPCCYNVRSICFILPCIKFILN